MAACLHAVTKHTQPPTSESKHPIGRTQRLLRLAILFCIAAAFGWLFERIGAPLPWMIGPLVVTAAIFLTGRFSVSVPLKVRPFGQMVVACQVGLTFSPAALQMLLELAPVIVGTALMTGVCVFGVAALLSRFSGLGLVQGFLAAVPTSPVEATAMAIKAGVDPMPVVFSQTLRLSAVVIIVPFAMYAVEGWPEIERTISGSAVFDPMGMALLVAIGVVGVVLFKLARIPNPYFLGPLTLTAALAATGHGIEPFPAVILAAAQVVLGTWLGSSFRRDLIKSAGKLAIACIVSIALVLALSSAGAIGIALVSGLDWRILVLGAAPGGVVEMALTAKFLGQNVALITAFHLTRIFIFMPNVPWVVALIDRYEKRRALSKGAPNE